ncbi:MAG: hypothetical protein GXN93_01750 [Candidatus Diapherotrites archaeon]|nr:hypothetical protein [Candidatus Diapherotrites archaeon]
MGADKRYVYAGIGILVLVVLAFIFWPRGSTAGIPAGGTVTISFMGAQIPLVAVSGSDIDCIGAPSGYIRVYYDHSSDEYGEYTTVGYAKQGEDADAVISWIKARAEACGFTKTSESSGSAMGAYGTSLSFESTDGQKNMSFDVAVVPGSDGKKYTLIRLSLDVYTEGSAEENTSSTSSGSSSSSPQGIVVSGDLKTWDDTIRPLLSSVFGGVTLTSAVQVPSSGGYGFEYATARPVASGDAQKIVSAFTSAGWQQLSLELTSDHMSIGFMKDKDVVGVDADIEGTTVSVAVYSR